MKHIVGYLLICLLSFGAGWLARDASHEHVIIELKKDCCQPKVKGCHCSDNVCKCKSVTSCDCWGKEFCKCEPVIGCDCDKTVKSFMVKELVRINQRIFKIEDKLKDKVIEFCPQK